MKHYYYSEVLHQMFDSEKECLKAEEKDKNEKAERKRLGDERAKRWAEVEEANKKAYELHRQYNKDYPDNDGLLNLISFFGNPFNF